MLGWVRVTYTWHKAVEVVKLGGFRSASKTKCGLTLADGNPKPEPTDSMERCSECEAP